MPQKKPSNAKKARTSSRKKGGRKRRGSIYLAITVTLLIAIVCLGFRQGRNYLATYGGNDAAWVYIPAGASPEAVADSLTASLGKDFGKKVAQIWGGDVSAAHGAYRVTPGQRAWSVARRINRGQQTPVTVTFNNVRTLDILSQRLDKRMEFSARQFLAACDSVADSQHISRDTFPTLILPDSYEAYWTESPSRLIERFQKAHKRFWTSERLQKANNLGLTPAQAYIIASIAEEESADTSELGKIGRLYINRLQRGMMLQADPTVKFASGNLTARRISGAMLKTDSPYNTYRHHGLPPGPIRLASASTIDAILNSTPHDYIYMCASPDFSGTHNFAKDFDTHRRNADAYRRALDARGIK